MVNMIDFPHTRRGRGKWLKTGVAPVHEPGASYRNLCFFAQKLRDLGMSDVDICSMFAGLYWDAFDEFRLNKTYASYEEEEKAWQAWRAARQETESKTAGTETEKPQAETPQDRPA